ncbi:MAG TPA: hypothetical protein VHH88_00410, partial [Verrucomicrobiae bacterium]|nr:hypothetical protein [Verrucomicrobiae bacterium]
MDHATPQPAQKFTPKEFLAWAKKQLTLAETVHSCYEACPFGYGLHRALTAMGIQNVVVRPQDWDELHKGVKTGKTDALALVLRLDRYVQGNVKALAVICVSRCAATTSNAPHKCSGLPIRNRRYSRFRNLRHDSVAGQFSSHPSRRPQRCLR